MMGNTEATEAPGRHGWRPGCPAWIRSSAGDPGWPHLYGGWLTRRGKTTLGNQLAFHHAATGGQALVTTLLAEAHDLMLANLRGFRFFDPALVGDRVHYLNLFDALAEEGLDGIIAAVRRVARESNASLLVVDGAAVIEDVAPLSSRCVVSFSSCRPRPRSSGRRPCS